MAGTLSADGASGMVRSQPENEDPNGAIGILGTIGGRSFPIDKDLPPRIFLALAV
jgi:hypothetical protein